jgi:hypothetical protein
VKAGAFTKLDFVFATWESKFNKTQTAQDFDSPAKSSAKAKLQALPDDEICFQPNVPICRYTMSMPVHRDDDMPIHSELAHAPICRYTMCTPMRRFADMPICNEHEHARAPSRCAMSMPMRRYADTPMCNEHAHAPMYRDADIGESVQRYRCIGSFAPISISASSAYRFLCADVHVVFWFIDAWVSISISVYRFLGLYEPISIIIGLSFYQCTNSYRCHVPPAMDMSAGYGYDHIAIHTALWTYTPIP